MLQTRLISTEPSGTIKQALVEPLQTFDPGIFRPPVGFAVQRQDPEWQGAQTGPQKPPPVRSSRADRRPPGTRVFANVQSADTTHH